VDSTLGQQSLKSILIFVEIPFNARDFDRMGISTLSETFSVFLFDLSTMFNPSYPRSPEGFSIESFTYIHPLDVSELNRSIGEIDRIAVVVDYLLEGPAQSALRSLISSRGITAARYYSEIPKGVYPLSIRRTGSEVKRHILRTANRLRTIASCRIADKICNKISIWSGLACGRIPSANLGQRVDAHSMDYDIFLREGIANDCSSFRYGVFLDQGLYRNHDRFITGNRAPYLAEPYGRAMENFFCGLEDRFGYPIFVARHPRAKGDDIPFAHWRLLTRSTATLIQSCSLVLTHYSTATSFAILWGKPLVVVSSGLLESTSSGSYIRGFAKELGAPVVNFELATSQHFKTLAPKVDVPRYQRYKSLYLKVPGTQENGLWRVFSDAILSKR